MILAKLILTDLKAMTGVFESRLLAEAGYGGLGIILGLVDTNELLVTLTTEFVYMPKYEHRSHMYSFTRTLGRPTSESC